MTHKLWPRDFPRIAELYQELQSTGAYEQWFERLPDSINISDLIAELYVQREEELAALDPVLWQAFKQEILNQKNDNRRKLITLFDEAAGYSVLRKMLGERSIGYDDIKIPSGVGKKPDWVAIRNQQEVAALEVKTVFESASQTEFIEANTQALRQGGSVVVKRLNPEIARELLEKLNGVVEVGKGQVRAIQGPLVRRVVYVIVNLDYEAAQVANARCAIESHLESLSEPDVIVRGDVRGSLIE